MSRIVERNADYEIAYGEDHVLGHFIQVFRHGNEDTPVVDRDGISVNEVVSIAWDYGFDLSGIML